MNKSETIDQIARSADIPKAAAKRALDSLETHIKAHIDAGERVLLRGLGSFSRSAPAQKAGRNPRTAPAADLHRLSSGHWRAVIQRKQAVQGNQRRHPAFRRRNQAGNRRFQRHHESGFEKG